MSLREVFCGSNASLQTIVSVALREPHPLGASRPVSHCRIGGLNRIGGADVPHCAGGKS